MAVLSAISMVTRETPATLYPERCLVVPGLCKTRYRKGLYHSYFTLAPDYARYRYFRADNSITVTTLEIEREVCMVDDPPHWWSIR